MADAEASCVEQIQLPFGVRRRRRGPEERREILKVRLRTRVVGMSSIALVYAQYVVLR